MVRMLVKGCDLHRITTTRSAKVQKSLVTLWDKYESKEVPGQGRSSVRRCAGVMFMYILL
ncbi:hypothetical protein DPMN_174281 [Dreissena polymorpha]|uniref:Uncharacterized protein n=1 Tax=Dreissena polymorpha TaxID=45954 RepID=A0A9D4E648_DREPO|nr:hypothetical protein DPMN_174281 [Dreissena polymorpha]